MAGATEFIARTDELMNRVGQGKIQASVLVDQVYAHFQHERTDLRHPRGGTAHYLRNPLFAGTPRWLRQVGAQMTHRNMVSIFVDIADDLSGGVAQEAPEFMGDLRNSGEPRVKEGGRFVWRGTAMPRLSNAYADAKTALWHSIYGPGS
jgi:hypothetical protein